MPKKNVTGGKNFKKGRKLPTDGGADDKRFDGLDDGQDLGRVTKMLGNRRVLCFCGNDGMERVCKIRGVLCKGPKKQRIEIGDIVMISSRDFSDVGDDDSDDGDGPLAKKGEVAKAAEGGAITANGKRDVYDIITKLAPSQIRDARKNQKGLHKMLFELAGEHRAGVNAAFEFGYESDDAKPAEDEGTGRVDKRDKIRHRSARGGAGAGDDGGDAMPAAPSRTAAAASSDSEDADLDVDAI